MGKIRSAKTATNYAGLSLRISYRPLDELRPAPNAVRRHPKRQIKQIARGIENHGFLVPVIIYGDGVIAAGHARVEAARLLGMQQVPVVHVDHLTDEQMRMFAIADNKLAEGGIWDLDALRIEFAEIAMAAPEINQDSSGFHIAERDIIFGRHRENELTDFDAAPASLAGPAVARVGDVFSLGRHTLVCGDATDPAVIAAAVGDRQVRTMLSDLPYNVKIAGNVSGRGSSKHQDFELASGEMSRVEFTSFLSRALEASRPALVDGALLYLFMDFRHLIELLTAAERSELSYLNLLVWAKTNAGLGSYYRSAHELIGFFKRGAAPHTNNVELGRHGRNRTNVLHYPGVSGFSKGRQAALALHPTVKPVSLLADLILDSSAPGEIILDPFGGSGSTLMAAEKTDRTACLVEISPNYVDATVRRFETATGKAAILASTGQTFADVAAEQREIINGRG
jgi:DNA modification methylase